LHRCWEAYGFGPTTASGVWPMAYSRGAWHRIEGRGQIVYTRFVSCRTKTVTAAIQFKLGLVSFGYLWLLPWHIPALVTAVAATAITLVHYIYWRPAGPWGAPLHMPLWRNMCTLRMLRQYSNPPLPGTLLLAVARPIKLPRICDCTGMPSR
jgi:hypothetical protein